MDSNGGSGSCTTSTTNKTHKCQICFQELSSMGELKNHVNKFHKAQDNCYPCPECNSIFKRRDHLGRHIMTQHEVNTQRTSCPFKDCDTQMVRKDHLRRHVSQVHKVDPSDYLPTIKRRSQNNSNSDTTQGGSSSTSSSSSSGVDPLAKFKCVFTGCDAELSRKDHLCRHIKNVHKADPREVIGHLYKQPRPGEEGVGGGVTTAAAAALIPIVSPVKSPPKKKRKRGGVGGEGGNDDDCSPMMRRKKSEHNTTTAHSSSDHHPNLQSHHPHPHPPHNQPHPSTLSDYDYGADFHDAFEEEEDMIAVTQGAAEEWKVDAALCILCCYSFYYDDDDDDEDKKAMDSQSIPSNSVQFRKFFSEVLYDGNETNGNNAFVEMFGSLSSINSSAFSVCSDCLPLLNATMAKKVGVDEVEIQVRRLQLEILNDMKKLEERLDAYCKDMIKMEKVVQRSDVSCLEKIMKRNLVTGKKEHNTMALQFRDRVISVARQLMSFKEQLEGKIGDGTSTHLHEKRLPSKRRPKLQQKRKNEVQSVSTKCDIKIENGSDAEEVPSSSKETFIKDEFMNDHIRDIPIVPGKTTPNAHLSSDNDENSDYGERDSPYEDDQYFNAEEISESDEEVLSSTASDSPEDEKDELPVEDTSLTNLNKKKRKRATEYQSESEKAEGVDVETSAVLKPVLLCPVDECSAKLSRRDHLRRHIRSVHKIDPEKVMSQSKIIKKKVDKERTPQKPKKEEMISGICTSNWSQFKRRMLVEANQRQNRRDKVQQSYTDQDIADPRLKYVLEYNSTTDTFSVGSIIVIVHEEENTLECSKCSYRATATTYTPKTGKVKLRSKIMEQHIQLKHLSVFQCPLCDSVLGSFRRYSDHLMGHQKKITCAECKKVYFSPKSLARHRWNKHMTEDQVAQALAQGQRDPRIKKKPKDFEKCYQCETCGKAFRQPGGLKLHEETHLENREKFMCPGCGKMFFKMGLVHHQRNSCFPKGKEPEKAKCEFCPQSNFKTKYMLQRHMKYTHSQAAMERVFKCIICGKGLKCKNSLDRHVATHSDARPWICRKGCGATYKMSKHRIRHEHLCKGEFTGKSVARMRRSTGEEDAEPDNENEKKHPRDLSYFTTH